MFLRFYFLSPYFSQMNFGFNQFAPMNIAILFLFSLPLPIETAPLSTIPQLNITNATSPYAGFTKDPDGRGTVSLVISCLITLLLCVWQALHLNVPKKGERPWDALVMNVLWISIGVYAPELVVFTAWRQWSSAQLLRKIANEEIAMKDHNAPNGEGDEGTHTEQSDRICGRSKRKYHWTQVHSFFASTGGFAFEIDDDSPYANKSPQTPFLPAGCPRRLTLTARGVALLARCGLLPDIPEADIQDKSKANNMAKALVVLQASWMLVQVVGRLADHLPVTLLEINTVAHVLCAFLMYAMWWNKPLLPEEPLILRGDWVEPLCAYMYICSELSGCANKRTVASKSLVKRLFVSMKVYSKIPEAERLCICMDERSSGMNDTRQQWPDASSTLTLSSRRSLEDLRDLREATKSSETAFFERRPRIATADRTSILPTPVHLRRWELAAQAIHAYPVLRSQPYVLHSHPTPIDNGQCIHPQPTELVRPHIQNWPYDDLLRNVGGLTVGMILWLSNFIYGGLHASAWNDHFPSTIEKWLWRGSCSYISFAGGLWIVLNWLAAAYPPLNDFWERWMDGTKGKVWGLFLGIIVFTCGFSFGVARVYLVLEAFISIRSLPRGAYDTPNWSALIPHF